MRIKLYFIFSLVIILLVLLAACNIPGISTASATEPSLPPGGESPFSVTETPQGNIDTNTPLAPIFFEVAAIVDTTSEPVTRDQAQSLVTDANYIFFNLTPFGVYMVDFVEDSAGGTMDQIANRYISSHASALPDGIIIFSFGDDGQAKLYGGYAFTLPGPAGFRNPFNSPVVGNTNLYIGIVHYSHKFAACGYGDSDTVQSTVSIDGECRNQPGTACVEHNGYSMCSNAVNDLYASTPTYFGASTIIHEILHSFSPGGKTDHYGTPECNARMGWPEGYFDPIEADFYNNMCPFVYDNFTSSYQP
jgi:hypothetical protein